MNYKIVYFTRTGTSKRIAEKIAEKLSCDIIEVTDNINWKGILGFLKGGYYSSKNKEVKIKVSKDINVDDELIVVTPLWAGYICPAMRTFLKSIKLDNVHLIVTSNGSKLKDRVYYKSINDIVKSKNNEDKVISDFIKKFAITIDE